MASEASARTANTPGSRQQQPRRTGRQGQGIIEANRKTEICKHWLQGSCPFGGKCAFAHGARELRKPASENNHGNTHDVGPAASSTRQSPNSSSGSRDATTSCCDPRCTLRHGSFKPGKGQQGLDSSFPTLQSSSENNRCHARDDTLQGSSLGWNRPPLQDVSTNAQARPTTENGGAFSFWQFPVGILHDPASFDLGRADFGDDRDACRTTTNGLDYNLGTQPPTGESTHSDSGLCGPLREQQTWANIARGTHSNNSAPDVSACGGVDSDAGYRAVEPPRRGSNSRGAGVKPAESISLVAAASSRDPTPSSGATCCCRCRCSSSSPRAASGTEVDDDASRRSQRTASEHGPSSNANCSDPNPAAAAAAAASKSVASTSALPVPPTPNPTFFASTAGFWDPMPFGHPLPGDYPSSSAPAWPSAGPSLEAAAPEPAAAAKSFSAAPGQASRQGKHDHRRGDKVDALLAGVMSALELDSSPGVGDGDKNDSGDGDDGRGPIVSATMIPWDGPAHLPPTERGSPSVSRVLGSIPEASDNSARSVSDRNSMGTSPSPSYALPLTSAGSSQADGGWQPLSALSSTPEGGLLQAIAGNGSARHASTSFDWGLETSSVGSSTPVSSNVLKTPIGGFPSSVW